MLVLHFHVKSGIDPCNRLSAGHKENTKTPRTDRSKIAWHWSSIQDPKKSLLCLVFPCSMYESSAHIAMQLTMLPPDLHLVPCVFLLISDMA